MKDSKIQWCDHTFNPWIGCRKVSPGCANCYAERETFNRVQRANGNDLWAGNRHRTSEAYWAQPLKWELAAQENGARPRVFCGSMCDWLDDAVPAEWFIDLMMLIMLTPKLDWLLLTKRPEQWSNRIGGVLNFCPNDICENLWRWLRGHPLQNIWFGVSIEDQKRADERIPILKIIPAKVRFLSVEPMLQKIILPSMEGVHWVICGGESGSKLEVRDFQLDWAYMLKRQCEGSKIPFFMKQLGSRPVIREKSIDWFPELKDPKGGDMNEWPEDLRVREFPEPNTKSALRYRQWLKADIIKHKHKP